MSEPPTEPSASDSTREEAIAAVLGGVPEIRLHEASAIATHLPGRRIPGVRLKASDVEVHAALVYPTTVEEAAGAVRAALAPLSYGTVDVTIDDVVLPQSSDTPDLGDAGIGQPFGGNA